ncbi:hypothetical protein [Fulvimarina sp. MAC3]|uniref:hypothetical protein n=1 Tax=Fulvimarina sp. MAC3 TaxID=3148887 RepID=UPI0031FC026A
MSSVNSSSSGHQNDILSLPISKTPVAGMKSSGGGLLRSIGVPNLPERKPSDRGALPPEEMRTMREEAYLKTLHRSDVALLGVPSTRQNLWEKPAGAQEASQQWRPLWGDSPPVSTGDEGKEIRALIDYASGLEANALLLPPDEGDSSDKKDEAFSFKAGDKQTATNKADLATGQTETSRKRSREAAVSYSALKKRWQLSEKKDEEGAYQNHIRAFGADVDISGGAGRFTEDGRTMYGAKGGASANASFLTWKNKLKGDGIVPAEAGLDVAVVKAEAKAGGEATVNFAEGEATLKGELGAEVTLVEIETNGKVTVIPTRLVDSACDHTWLGSWDWSKELCEVVATDEYDYGVVLGGAAGGNIGVGGKAEGGLERKNGHFKASGKAKIAAGLGLSGGGSIEAGHFNRD